MSKTSKKTGLTELQEAVLSKNADKVDILVNDKNQSIFETGNGYYTPLMGGISPVKKTSEFLNESPIEMAYSLSEGKPIFHIFDILIDDYKEDTSHSTGNFFGRVVNTNDDEFIAKLLESANFKDNLNKASIFDLVLIMNKIESTKRFKDVLKSGAVDKTFDDFISEVWDYIDRNDVSSGYSIIHYAVYSGWDAMKLEALLDHNPNSGLDKEKLLPLAIDIGNLDNIKKLIDKGLYEIDIDKFATIQDAQVLDILCKHDPEILTAKNDNGQNILDLAVEARNHLVIRYFNGSDLENSKFLETELDNEILDSAKLIDSYDLYKVLSDTSVDIEDRIQLAGELIKKDETLITRLFSSQKETTDWFCGRDLLQPEAIKFLLESLVDKELLNNKATFSGTNLLDLYIEKRLSCPSVLLDNGFYRKEMHDVSVIVDILIENGADVNVQDKFGWTILDKLSAKGDDESPLVKLLLMNDAKYNKQFSVKFNNISIKKRRSLEKYPKVQTGTKTSVKPLLIKH